MDLQSVVTLAGASILMTVLVQLAKQYVPERAVPALALALGVVVVVLAGVALGHATPEQIGTDVATGLLAGAASIGWYQAQKPVGILPPKG